MKLIRLLAAAGVAALVLLAGPGTGPAMAANDVTINSPADLAYETYPTLSGSVSQSGNQGVVTKIDLKLTSVDGSTSENASLTYTRGASNSSVFSGDGATVNFSWVPKPKYNGRYTFTVNGTGTYSSFGTRTETGGSSRSFNIAIQPAKPTGVEATMPENSTKVTVTWNPNPEPDILGYQVFRSYANGNASPLTPLIAASPKPTFNDDLAGKPQGQYKYNVQAIRKTCPSECEGVRGPNSNYSAAVTVRAAIPTTTTTSTTVKPKPGGGSTGGGSTGGGSTGGGSTGGGSTGGGSTGGTKTPTGKTAPKNSGGFAPGGNVDLSQFGNLLGGNGKTTRTPGQVDEGTYDAEIKGYDSSENSVDSNNDDNSLITIGGASVPKPSDDWVRFIGAGSLATALLVHVLWFKQQVDSIPLEALTD